MESGVFVSIYIALYLSSAVRAEIQLRGAGASFPDPVYKSWIPSYKAYRQQHISLNLNYDPVGSGTGKKRIIANVDIEYAGSDSRLSASDSQQDPDLVMFPTMAGAVVIAYNVPGCSPRLNLTRYQIVGIFNGTVRNWNDTSFIDKNPNCVMPNATIKVIARADKSGTTEIFTEGLAAFSEAWNNTYGTFAEGIDTATDLPEKWKADAIFMYGNKNGGMSGLISSIKYSVGYLSVAEADAQKIKYAVVENRRGKYVSPTSSAVQGAMDYAAEVTHTLMTSLADGDNDDAYPMAGYTYFIVHLTTMDSCESARELVRYIEWFNTEKMARKTCEDSKMAPLSQKIIDRVTDQVLKKMTCHGQNVWALMEANKQDEIEVDNTWIIPVAVCVPLFLILIFGLLGYILLQKYRLNKMIDNNEWDIPIEDIVFYFDDKATSSGKSKLLGMRSIKSLKSIEDIPEGSEILFQILQWPGKLHGNTIGIRLLEVKELKMINRAMKRDMLWLRDKVMHVNVVRFFGLSELDGERYVIGEYCGKGPMTDILQDAKYTLNNDFKFSLAFDIAIGMAFLHGLGIVHGHLTSTHCFVDSRWTVKIGDWEYIRLLQHVKSNKNPFIYIHKDANDIGKQEAAFRDFWVAPEVLRSDLELPCAPSGDVYSFAIILQEIFTREDPYAEHAGLIMPDQVIKAILNNNLRPQPSDDTPIRVRQIMEIAWSETATSRPSFEQMNKMMRQCRTTRKSVLDSMMEAMEDYTTHLESRIEERTSELFVAKSNIQHMLKDAIPPHLVNKLSNGETIETRIHSMLGVVLVEIVNMKDLVETSSAQDIIVYLNDTHSELEKIFNRYDAYRTNLQGDTFTVTVGLNHEIKNDLKRAEEIPHLCLDLLNTQNKVPHPSNLDRPFEFKIAAHAGSVVTGVLGTAAPKFVALGETVEMVKHVIKLSEPQKCLITNTVYSLIEKSSTFDVEEANNMSFQDQILETFWLTGRHCTFVDIQSDTSTDSGIDADKNRPNSRDSDKSQEDAIVVIESAKQSVELKKNSKWLNKAVQPDNSKRKYPEKSNSLRPSKNNRISPLIEETSEL
ncbi:speract receptor [Patella vulgata]|uniref:speract receptor n=1 Tax=Patella vulgata TaxID=6465 RepID=UPI0021806331|nr:speract receptor [Patella vulgata]